MLVIAKRHLAFHTRSERWRNGEVNISRTTRINLWRSRAVRLTIQVILEIYEFCVKNSLVDAVDVKSSRWSRLQSIKSPLTPEIGGELHMWSDGWYDVSPYDKVALLDFVVFLASIET